jgi:TRAP-type C4-dicarboxylate transport system permease large subunit
MTSRWKQVDPFRASTSSYQVSPDIPLRDVVWGVLPFVGLMFVAIFLICLLPGIATGFPNWVMGPGR